MNYISYTFLKRVITKIQCVHQQRCAWLKLQSKTKIPHTLAHCTLVGQVCRYASEQKHKEKKIINLYQVETLTPSWMQTKYRYV